MENPIHIERDEEREHPGQRPDEAATEVAGATPEGRPVERTQGPSRKGLRGTAAMDPDTRQEVARKGGLAVSRNRQHMAEIGRKGGQTVSKNRDHMASIGRKGGEASRGQR
jgi:general stress protein YciG